MIRNALTNAVAGALGEWPDLPEEFDLMTDGAGGSIGHKIYGSLSDARYEYPAVIIDLKQSDEVELIGTGNSFCDLEVSVATHADADEESTQTNYESPEAKHSRLAKKVFSFFCDAELPAKINQHAEGILVYDPATVIGQISAAENRIFIDAIMLRLFVLET